MNKKILKNIIFLLFLSSRFTMIFCSENDFKSEANIKVLVLIIASDNLPIYIQLQNIWKSYMHYNPKKINAYFIRGNPSIAENFQITSDTLWLKTEESLKTGVTTKTILAFETALSQLPHFDYILRTNLSSFYIFDRVLSFLEKAPKNDFYCGFQNYFSGVHYASGSGFFLSRDLVELIVKNKNYFLDQPNEWDDLIIGKFLHSQGKKVVDQRMLRLANIKEWDNNKKKIPKDIFQIRVRSCPLIYDCPERLTQEIPIHKELLKMFYGIR